MNIADFDPNKVTRAQLESVPRCKDEIVEGVKAIVLLPTRRKHDSGYNIMHFVLVLPDRLLRVEGICDVLEIASGARVECWRRSNLLSIYPSLSSRTFRVKYLPYPTVTVEEVV